MITSTASNRRRSGAAGAERIPARESAAAGAGATAADDRGRASRPGPAPGPAKAGLDQGILAELLGYQLRRAQLAVFQDFATAMAEQDIRPGQVGLLVLVSRNPGISQAALAKAAGVERSTLGEAIERLVERGLMERRAAPRDRRSYALRLSANGRQFLDALVPRLRAHEDRVAAHLSASERSTLLALLSRLADGPQPANSV